MTKQSKPIAPAIDSQKTLVVWKELFCSLLGAWDIVNGTVHSGNLGPERIRYTAELADVALLYYKERLTALEEYYVKLAECNAAVVGGQLQWI